MHLCEKGYQIVMTKMNMFVFYFIQIFMYNLHDFYIVYAYENLTHGPYTDKNKCILFTFLYIFTKKSSFAIIVSETNFDKNN